MAAALFRVGNFADALEKFKKVEDPTPDEKYMMSRSYEETGKIQQAISGYTEAVNGGTDSDSAVKANRRLMLIGNFYNGGKEVREFSQQAAIKQRDTAVLKDVQEGKELQLKPLIVEKLLNSKNAKQSGLVDEIRKDLDKAIEEKTNPTPPIPKERLEEIAAAPKAPVFYVANTKLALTFRDGRIVRGMSIAFGQEGALVFAGTYELNIPFEIIERIDPRESGVSLQITPAEGEGFEVGAIRCEGEKLFYNRAGKDESISIASIREIKAL